MRIYTMRSRNPFITALLVIAGLAVLVMMFTVGLILLTGLAAVALVLTAGFVVRRKLGLGRSPSTLSADDRVSARLDPSMEVKPVQKQLPPNS
jgi:uncharacterized protein (DUF58 family)